jgi:putative transposase
MRYGYTAAHRRADGPSGMNTDLTDAEWVLVADLFERDGQRGAPPRFERRHMVNACCYALRTGCAWRLLPKTFPPWQASYKSFSRWAAAGVFEAMHDRLRQQWRNRMGKAPEPTAAIIDAQSTRSTAQGGNTGFDAGKKVKGRKRHLVVDTLGLLLAVTVTAASVQDRDAAAEVVAQACTKVPGLKKVYADGAYGGKCAVAIEQAHGIIVQIVRHPGNRSTGTWQDAQQPLWPEVVATGFVVQAKRWVVERTHAWNERARRLMVHHDRSNWAPGNHPPAKPGAFVM